MPNVKISDLAAATSLALADLVEVEQGAVSKRGTLDLVRAALGVPLSYTTTVDEVRNNTTTPATVAALTAPVDANTEYVFQLDARISSPTATPDLSVGFQGPTGAAGEFTGAQTTTTGNQATGLGAQSVAGTIAAGAPSLIRFRGRVRTGATAGNLEVRIAQGTATVEDTVMHRNAVLQVTRVGVA